MNRHPLARASAAALAAAMACCAGAATPPAAGTPPIHTPLIAVHPAPAASRAAAPAIISPPSGVLVPPAPVNLGELPAAPLPASSASAPEVPGGPMLAQAVAIQAQVDLIKQKISLDQANHDRVKEQMAFNRAVTDWAKQAAPGQHGGNTAVAAVAAVGAPPSAATATTLSVFLLGIPSATVAWPSGDRLTVYTGSRLPDGSRVTIIDADGVHTVHAGHRHLIPMGMQVPPPAAPPSATPFVGSSGTAPPDLPGWVQPPSIPSPPPAPVPVPAGKSDGTAPNHP